MTGGMVESDPNVLYGAATGKPIYQAQHVGNGMLMLTFRLDDSGKEVPITIPLSAIGNHYQQYVRREITK